MTVSRHNVPEPATLMTDRQVADRLAVSVRTVREYRADGRLSTVDLGYRTKRTLQSDVDRLIEARTRR